MKSNLKLIEDVDIYENVICNIQSELKDYLIKSGLKSLIIGVSGGIDSAICCALAHPVCLELKIPLIGRFIQIESNKKEEQDRANDIAKYFCDEYQSIDLTDTYHSILPLFDDNITINEKETEINKKIRYGNIKARLRMIYLYDLAQKNKGMVLSTDNLTEYFLGFWTLHGDVGNYGMIQNLWKTEVYDLSREYIDIYLKDFKQAAVALFNCIIAVPTDGLGITNSDLEQIGVSSYYEVDKIILSYLSNLDGYYNDVQLKVIDRIKKSNFKRLDPQSIDRNILIK